MNTDPLIAMDAALTDAMAQLKQAGEPPYYLSLALAETRSLTIQGTHGVISGVVPAANRVADVDMRVGSMELDNTHKLRDAGWFSEPERASQQAPISDDPGVLRALFMRAIDDTYRSASKQLIKVRANEQVKVEREDQSADFSAAPVVEHIAPLPQGDMGLDVEDWQQRMRDASAIYLNYPDVYDSAVEIVATAERRWLINNEGTRIADGRMHYRVATWALTVADDGMQLQVYDYTDYTSTERLPDAGALAALVRGVAEQAVALRRAPVIEPFEGPAILRGRATGVFFHEIFGHRIEGHRQKDEEEGQTFTDRVGQAILPPFLSVIDDPTMARWGDVDLNGHYAVDDEGVRAERVNLVERGILRGFLMGRSPVEGFDRSNGHGRREPGAAPVARQGNLTVQAHEPVSYLKLREMLVAEVKKQGKPFGLVIDDITGGFTFTGRSTPNSFSVQPVTVWKVYPDGRPDELVRGVDLIGTPLVTFSRIRAAADDTAVFNGVCGAESGWVPVSAIAPSVLVEQIEVQRREKQNDRPPILPPPLPDRKDG